MKCLATAAVVLCTVAIGAEARKAPPVDPQFCAQVRQMVAAAGSVAAAEALARHHGIYLTAAQRRQAIACLSR